MNARLAIPDSTARYNHHPIKLVTFVLPTTDIYESHKPIKLPKSDIYELHKLIKLSMTVIYKLHKSIKHFSWPLLFLQVDVDPCHPNPCLNGASCFNVQGDYYCHCSDHWEGRHCENTKSTCMSGSCQGKATQLINIYWKLIPIKMGEWVKHIEVIIMYFKSRSISHYIS